MDKDKATWFRRDIEDLIVAQNTEMPMCPYDGEPCENPERSCQAVAFGSIASDGDDKFLWQSGNMS